MNRDEARRYREIIEQAAQSLPDATALTVVELHPQWAADTEYAADYKVRCGGNLYRCLIPHTSQIGWEPHAAPSLWAPVLIESPDTIPDWVQPESTNGYSIGDKVRHNGKLWASTIDNNVWEPGVYGWELVEC